MSNNQQQKVISFLSYCGLSQYTETFLAEGFERIESLMEITEVDLIQMQVKRGHRRLIQRALSDTKELQTKAALTIEPRCVDFASDGNSSSSQMSSAAPLHIEHTYPSAGTMSAQSGMSSTEEEAVTSDNVHRLWKRKYHRHPKPDIHSPHKPPSAYVMFSNDIRVELKQQNRSFTDLAKIIGDRWKNISAKDKERYELNAQKAREVYAKEVEAYQQTESFKQYQKYLSEFKAENEAAARPVGRPRKRPSTKDQTDTVDVSQGTLQKQYPFYLLNADNSNSNNDTPSTSK
ncbi:high mobility group box domain-containing protein [Sporodiniella umbellata]|nr:high mobility group box domain-containing protein [Sporodiniella umbellata]